jgi:hypothetical protein
MGTPRLPDLKPPSGGESSILKDVPKTGPVLWILLMGFLIPPCAVAFIGNLKGGIPNQALWVILLGIPIPLVLLSLPRMYTIDSRHLTISGFLYKKRIPLEEIESVEPVKTHQALSHPGSLFCSDPARALKLVRKPGRTLIISPTDPAPFLALSKGHDRSEGGRS